MTTPLTSLLANPYAVFMGWALVVVLWLTTSVGLLFGAWRILGGARRSATAYGAGLAALFAAAALSVIVPASLAALAAPSPAPRILDARVSSAIRATLMPLAPGPANGLEQIRTEAARTLPLDAIAAAAALLWAAAVLVLGVRLAGGIVLTHGLARRARPVNDEALTRAAKSAAARLGVRRHFALLESSEVEAPAVLGWSRPRLLVPAAAVPRLGPEQMSAILVHELAHIRRRDYPVNLLQSIVELPLFFCPAVRWMSRCVREAREFCCDDEAVEQCGDRAAYVEALTTLAALCTMNAHRVQGISGPRLVTRVRRLLKEEPVPRFTTVRVSVLAAALAAVVVSGLQLSAASALRAPNRAGLAPQPRIPYGYAWTQKGSGLEITGLVAHDDGTLRSATLRNVTNERVIGVRFVAAVERRDERVPVRVFGTEELPIAIAPNGTTTVTADILTANQIGEVTRESLGAPLQTFFALQSVRFANGYVWQITPNRDAMAGPGVISTPMPILPRAFLDLDAAKAPVPGGGCLDDRGGGYSPGAVLPILNEPGRFMKCADGRWVDAR